MRLRVTKCKNTEIFYVIKTVYMDGKQKTITVERIGNTNEVLKRSEGEDPYTWSKKYVEDLNRQEKEGTRDILIKKSQVTQIEKNQETIQSLLQMKKTSPTETDSEVVSSEKYHYLLNLYSTEQDKLNSIKSDYLHLIQDFIGYVQNGDKIKLDLNNLTRVTNNNNTNNGYIDEEIDSNELGRINENDLLTDKDKDGFNYGNRINSRDSRGSNCNSFNRYNNTSIIEKKQIATLKSELKAAKNEIDRVTKKMNDANGILITIGNAIIKLMNEIQMTNQIKEYFILIFRLLTFSEEKIARLFGEKEKTGFIYQ